MSRKIQAHLVDATVELLREGGDRFGPPIGAVSRAPNGNIDAFLFDNPCDPQGENQRFALLIDNVDFRSRSGFANGGR